MTLTRRNLLSVAGAATGSTLLGVPSAAAATSRASADPWTGLRGMTASNEISVQDVADFAATGGNLLRIGFANTPLMRKTEPYDLDEEAFARLDQLLDACEAYGVYAVIDPHTFPGLRDNYTTFPDDAFWSDVRYHDLAVELWSYIACRYKDRGPVIAGYDLLNEPAVPDVRANSGPASWNALALRLIAAVREHDQDHHVLVASAISPRPDSPLWFDRFTSVNALPPPPDDKVVVTPHMYAPHAFTHQGVQPDYPEGVPYPGEVEGQTWEGLPARVFWDRAAIRRYLRPALDYQQTYQVPIYVGEFSTPRWIGEPGNRYLHDTIEEFERVGWSWSYHAWREWHGWDAELSNTDPDDLTRYESTERLELLRSYFRLNRPTRRGRGRR